MTTKNKILLQAANVLLCAAIILLTAFFMSGWSVLVQAAFYLRRRSCGACGGSGIFVY